jgi:hypothetical protein
VAGDLVLAAAIGYRPEQLVPFLRSLRKAEYEGSVALFVDRPLKRALEHDPLAADVTLVPSLRWVPMRFGFVQNARKMRLLWALPQALLWAIVAVLGRLPVPARWRIALQVPVATILHTPMEARFFRYRRFLRAHPFDRVLICDVRDVLFQRPPFDGVPPTGLAVSIETSGYTLATEKHNAAWIERVYGPDMLARIGSSPVANVGVTYGERAAITAYLERMTAEILAMSPRRASIGGADTAAHNMLVWTGAFGEVAQLPPLQSAVATLNEIDAAELRLDGDGQLLNRDGSLPSVLHQYDRQPSIRDELLAALDR